MHFRTCSFYCAPPATNTPSREAEKCAYWCARTTVFCNEWFVVARATKRVVVMLSFADQRVVKVWARELVYTRFVSQHRAVTHRTGNGVVNVTEQQQKVKEDGQTNSLVCRLMFPDKSYPLGQYYDTRTVREARQEAPSFCSPPTLRVKCDSPPPPLLPSNNLPLNEKHKKIERIRCCCRSLSPRNLSHFMGTLAS